MPKTLRIAQHELRILLARRSFILLTVGVPLIAAALLFGARLLTGGEKSTVGGIFPSPLPDQPIGFVDQAGIIRTVPSTLPPAFLRPFETQEEAASALERGEVGGYYIISPDFLESGRLVFVNPEFNPFSGAVVSWAMEYLIVANLVGDEKLAARIQRPLIAEQVSLAPQGGRDTSSPLAFIVPYVTVFLFFFTLTMSSSYLLQSVSREKESRIIEVLLSSVTPRQMLMGKVMGLGVAGLLQMALWLVSGLWLLRTSSQVFQMLGVFRLPSGFVVWGVLYFALGYALYASLMAGVGALAPRLREASQLTFFVLLPLMIPLWLMAALIERPHSTLSVTLSLIPFTAPVSMMTRLAAGGVPWWQPALSLLLLAVTTPFVIALAARLFRAQTLLSGAAITPRRVWEALRGE